MKRNLQRLLSVLLSISMIFVICPSSALAAGEAVLTLDSTAKSIEEKKSDTITATYTSETGKLAWTIGDDTVATLST